MSRVERTENPTEHRGSEQLRETQRGRSTNAPQNGPSAGPTPTKAEGELSDVEEALERQKD